MDSERWCAFETTLLELALPLNVQFGDVKSYTKMQDRVVMGALFSRLRSASRLFLHHRSSRLDPGSTLARLSERDMGVKGRCLALKPSQRLDPLLHRHAESEADHLRAPMCSKQSVIILSLNSQSIVN